MSSKHDEETNDPLIADHRNFYKVEKWTKDGSKVDHMRARFSLRRSTTGLAFG